MPEDKTAPRMLPYDAAIDIIRMLQSGGYDSEKEDNEKRNYLESAYPYISDLIFWNREGLTPEQIIKGDIEKSKPILL